MSLAKVTMLFQVALVLVTLSAPWALKLSNSVVRRHMSSQTASARTNTIAYSALNTAYFLVQSHVQIISSSAFEVFPAN